MRGVSKARQEERLARMEELYDAIERGDGPLDRIERFCRERQLVTYGEFMVAVLRDPEYRDLADFVVKSSCYQSNKIWWIKCRIAKVRKELIRAGVSVR